MIAADRASLIDLQTVYSVEDAYNMLEMALIDAYNRRLADKARNR